MARIRCAGELLKEAPAPPGSGGCGRRVPRAAEPPELRAEQINPFHGSCQRLELPGAGWGRREGTDTATLRMSLLSPLFNLRCSQVSFPWAAPGRGRGRKRGKDGVEGCWGSFLRIYGNLGACRGSVIQGWEPLQPLSSSHPKLHQLRVV